MNSILNQLKKRRKALNLKQEDMLLRIGVSRQQYQRLESKGNPRLDTLELVAKGLKCELLLIPQEKLGQVQAILDEKTGATEQSKIADDPWQDFLEDDK